MDFDDAEGTTDYAVHGVTETSGFGMVLTPAVRDQPKRTVDFQPEAGRSSEGIDFEAPKPFVWSCSGEYKLSTSRDFVGVPRSFEDNFFAGSYRKVTYETWKI